MKKFIDGIKLGMKEQLRIVGKVDINPGNDYLVKRRSFKDIDIRKDFEKRLRAKTEEERQEHENEQTIKFDEMSLDELDAYRKDKLIKLEEEKQTDIYTKVLITNEKKLFVLATIRAHEFYDKMFDDKKLHPKMRENMEKIEYHLNYNLPMEKRVKIF